MLKKLIYIMLALSYCCKYPCVRGFMRNFYSARNGITNPRSSTTATKLRTFRFLSAGRDLAPENNIRERSVKAKLPKISEISEEIARTELVYLDSELRRHNELYFEKNEPEISDAAYDKLVNRAEALVGKFRHLGELVPSLSIVGVGKSSKFASFTHSTPMLSLSKAFSTEELTSFMKRVDKSALNSDVPAGLEYVLEPKIDGLSLGVIYEYQMDSAGGKWCLTGAGTRGDGEVGENVTENVRKHLKSAIPESLSPSHVQSLLQQSPHGISLQPGTKIEVRGEVFISRSDFHTLNQQRAVAFTSTTVGREKKSLKDVQLATARNAAAGALRKINPSTSAPEASAQKYLQFFAYSLLVHTFSGGTVEAHDLLARQSDALMALRELGFKVAEPWVLCTSPIVNPTTSISSLDVDTSTLHTSVLSTCAAWEALRHQWDFDADGAVVKVNHVQLQQFLGTTSRCPKWAVAYKFAADKVLTSLRGIDVRVGRTGVLTPVARLEPVKVGGVMVESATLHNENEINRLKLHVGDSVWLKRAGDVIPKILGVERGLFLSADGKTELRSPLVGNNLPFRLPTECPECGSPTERIYSCRSTPKSNSKDSSALETSELPAVAGQVGTTEEGSPAGYSDDSDEPLVSVRCTGGAAVCPAQAIEQISHFSSKDAACIDGLGRSRVEDLFEGGIVKSILDLYELRHRDLNYSASSTVDTSDTNTNTSTDGLVVSLRGRKGWGDRSVNHLLAAIDKARLLDDYRFLFGLGVRHIGVENARLIVAEFGGFPALWTYLQEESDKLKAAGLQYHMLPRQRAVRKVNKKKTNQPTDNSAGVALNSAAPRALSEEDEITGTNPVPTLFLHECAPRLQAIDGLGPKAVQSLLEFAAYPRSAALVQGLLQHVRFTSQQPSSLSLQLETQTEADQKVSRNAEAGSGTSGEEVNHSQGGEGHRLQEAALLSDVMSPQRSSLPSTAVTGATQSLILSGRLAVFTGKLESGMSRNAAQALFESLGGQVRPSINKSVNLLVHAGDARASNKYKKALEMGIEVWTEDEWSKFIKRHS